MPLATPNPVRRSPLHNWHVAHGARMAESDGWLLPVAYGDPSKEAEIARNGVGLADSSALAKWSLRGRGVPAVSAALGITAIRSVARVDHSYLACRLTEQSILLLSATTGFLEPAALASETSDVLRTDVTSAYAGFGVVGKDAESVISRLTAFDVSLRAFPPSSCAETNLASVPALLVRWPVASVPRMGVYVAWDVAEFVWECLLHAGQDLSAAPLGHEALRLLEAAG